VKAWNGKLDTFGQRGATLALLTKNEAYVLTADEIVAAFNGNMSRRTVYKRLAELVEKGWVERLWFGSMPHPRFGLSDEFEEVVRKMLRRIVFLAGKRGITEEEANELLWQRVYDVAAGLFYVSDYEPGGIESEGVA
jgi:DNA-binding HxlR family transcriptional regulator